MDGQEDRRAGVTPGRVVAFGEVMWRLSPPGRELLLQTPRLESWLAGAEANVAVALARLGHDTALVSALPDNPLGDAALNTLRGHGVDCGAIRRLPGRIGLYFVSVGAGVRPSEATYDRAGSSFALAPPDGWDWPALLAGAGRLHLTGITPALGKGPATAALAAATAANALGVPVSFDGNYRARLWEARGVDPAPILRDLLARADILFGNDRDLALILGQRFVGDTGERRTAAATAAFAAFPRLQAIAATHREVLDVGTHLLSARIDGREGPVELPAIRLSHIVDRIGTGDAFVAGVLHGWAGHPTEHAARAGLHLAALKHTLPGDMTLFTARDLDAVAAGSMEVRR